MADNKDIREREKVVREIEKTAESIRKKHRALKTGKIEEDIATKSHFKPIIEPLQKIVDNSNTRAIKDEPRDDDDVIRSKARGGCKIEQEETIEYLVGSQIETPGRSWTGCVTDNLHTICDNRTTDNVRVTRKRGCFRNHGRLARGIHSKSVVNAGGSKNVERNVARTLGSVESKVRRRF